MVLEAGGLVYSTDVAAGHVGAVVHLGGLRRPRSARRLWLNHVTAPILSRASGNRRARWAPHRGGDCRLRRRLGLEPGEIVSLVQGDRDPVMPLA